MQENQHPFAQSDQPEKAKSKHIPRRGVLLINLGTPDRPDTPAVRRYLAEFLSDPSVIRLPRGLKWMTKPLGHMIALFRASNSARMYKTIWTDRGSPLKTITEDQVTKLQQQLTFDWRVFYAMRYGQPSIRETLQEIVSSGIEELVVIPMYPQFSDPSTGTAHRVLYQELARIGLELSVTFRSQWYDDAGYTHAQAELIHSFGCEHNLSPENTHLLFSAHSMPVSYIKNGDPYQRHILKSVELVAQRLGWPVDRYSLSYQSRLGPVEWLGPQTDEALNQLAKDGKKNVLVCPISFTADCLETLEEIGVRFRETFEPQGGKLFLCPALNCYDPFIQALKDLVLHGTRSISSWNHHQVPPLYGTPEKPADDPDVASLVMVGVSMQGRLDQGMGPKLEHTNIEDLRKVKRSQCEVPSLLRKIRDEVGFSEALLWNTCHRFEFYGWFNGAHGTQELKQQAIEQTRQHLFGKNGEQIKSVNVLRGAQAYHQLLRTSAGLNSSLPGERDIREQLSAAHRLAQCAGTAGPRANKLLADVFEIEREIRSKTDWGHYDPDYCYAALLRLMKTSDIDLASCQVMVIGGSTTSASVLNTLIEHFDMPSRQLTLLYRGHKKGGQVKMLRKAIGHGKRFRVQSYAEQAVIRMIAQADIVIFGIDREEPVLHADQLNGLRDFSSKPLLIIDFNMFGSTSGLDSIEGVRVISAQQLEDEVAAYADELCRSEHFINAVDSVDRHLVDYVQQAMPNGSKIKYETPSSCERIIDRKEKPASSATISSAEVSKINGPFVVDELQMDGLQTEGS